MTFYNIFFDFDKAIMARGWKSISKQPKSWIEAVDELNGRGPDARFKPEKSIAAFSLIGEHFNEISPFKIEKYQFLKKGGMIIMCAAIGTEKKQEIIRWFSIKLSNINSSLRHKNIIKRLLHGRKTASGFNIGIYFCGSFFHKESGNIYDASSFCVEITGIDRKTLYDIAEDFIHEHKQSGALLKDYETGDIKSYSAPFTAKGEKQ